MMIRGLAISCVLLVVALTVAGWLLRGAWQAEAQTREALRAAEARVRAGAVEVVRLRDEIARRDEITALLAAWRADLMTDMEKARHDISESVKVASSEYLAARAVPVPDGVFDRLREFAATGGVPDSPGAARRGAVRD